MPRELPFLWGAATSSHQIEGGNDKNDWWAWEAKGNIEGGARSGAATDHWNRFREDIRLASELGLNSYRFSIEWSRIEPEQGRWDPAALDWYGELVAECERQGLVPMATLHHFTSPQWFAEQGGFTWDQAPERFVNYVRHVAKHLGKRIPLWCTLNEPMVLVAGGYLAGIMPPATFSPASAALATHHLLKAHVLAYDALHADLDDPQVGIAHNLLDFCPDRPWHALERIFSRFAARFYNRGWLDAVTGGPQRFGVPGVIPSARPVPEAMRRKTVDFIGINYYTRAYIQWRRNRARLGVTTPLPIQIAFTRPKETASDLGWVIHPQGFAKTIGAVAAYGLPIYITENGIADREDKYRAEYIFSHLREVARAVRAGADIRGYYHWSLLDNFEWVKGFGPRFGLYEVDYETFERKARPSALAYRKIIEAHRNNGRPVAPRIEYFQ